MATAYRIRKYIHIMSVLGKAALVSVILSIYFGRAAAQDINAELTIEISTEKQTYTINEPIPIIVRLENVSNQTLSFYPPRETVDSVIYLKHKSMLWPERLEPMLFIYYDVSEERIVKLEPRESFAYEVYFGKKQSYDRPNKTGYHELFIMIDKKLDEFMGIKLWTGTLKSNTVGFTITDAD